MLTLHLKYHTSIKAERVCEVSKLLKEHLNPKILTENKSFQGISKVNQGTQERFFSVRRSACRGETVRNNLQVKR